MARTLIEVWLLGITWFGVGVGDLDNGQVGRGALEPKTSNHGITRPIL